MKQTAKILIPILIVAIIGLSFFFLYRQSPPPEQIAEFFDEFLTTYSTSSFEELNNYLYFEYPAYETLLEGVYANPYTIKIKKWEQINDRLWLANTYIENSYEPDGSINQYFIGEVNGHLRVMIGVYQVPEELASQESLSQYIPEGVLPADVILFP